MQETHILRTLKKNGNLFTKNIYTGSIEKHQHLESMTRQDNTHRKQRKPPDGNLDEIIQMSSTSLPSLLSTQQSAECDVKPYVKEPGGSQVPVAGGLFVATCIGSPVCFVAGIKLGMFAAIAGGIMGYTTGKMFADHEEKEALAKGEIIYEDGKIPSDVKKKSNLKENL